MADGNSDSKPAIAAVGMRCISAALSSGWNRPYGRGCRRVGSRIKLLLVTTFVQLGGKSRPAPVFSMSRPSTHNPAGLQLMAVNLNKPHRWKADIAESVRAYNRWFLASAPRAFREQREIANEQVSSAMAETYNLTRIDVATLKEHPEILSSLRMATAPPLARDRLGGLAGANKGLIQKMEKQGAIPPRMPPAELYQHLSRIGKVLTSLIDQDICPWIPEGRAPVRDEVRVSAIVIADRLCGVTANPVIRNAQEDRQLASVAEWLLRRGYRRIPSRNANDLASMPSGAFSFRMNVEGWIDEGGVKTVKIPVDIVVKSL